MKMRVRGPHVPCPADHNGAAIDFSDEIGSSNIGNSLRCSNIFGGQIRRERRYRMGGLPRRSKKFGSMLKIAGIIFLTILSCVVPFPAVTKEEAPVSITQCKGGLAVVEFVELAAYDIAFQNTAHVVADEVDVRVRYGRKKSVTFKLNGQFSPHVTIKRRAQRTVGFGLYSYESDQNQCSVEYVHFVDGTSWQAPSD